MTEATYWDSGVKLYKYMNHQFAERTLAGEFFIQRLIEFQLLECLTGDTTIGDRHEGSGQTVATGELTSDHPRAKELIDRGLVHVGEGATAVFIGTKFFNYVDCFVYCLSTRGPDDPPPLATDYDTCIEITDGDAFFKALHQHAVIFGPIASELGEIFTKMHSAPVSYTWMENDFFKDGIASASPFVKRAMYEPQAEHRIVFELDGNAHKCGDLSRIFLSCPQAAQLMKAVPFRELTHSTQEEETLPSLEALDQDLLYIHALYCKERELRWSGSSDVSEVSDDDFDARYREQIINLLWKRRKIVPSHAIDRAIARGDFTYRLLDCWHTRWRADIERQLGRNSSC